VVHAEKDRFKKPQHDPKAASAGTAGKEAEAKTPPVQKPFDKKGGKGGKGKGKWKNRY
jgi:hypothetical protein